MPAWPAKTGARGHSCFQGSPASGPLFAAAPVILRFFSSLVLLSLLPFTTLSCKAAADAPERPAPRAPGPQPPPPAGPVKIRLEVRETAGVARRGEIVRSGIPLPRSLGVRDPGRLAVVGEDGRPVPAQFEVLARWNAGLDTAEVPIQWVLAIFPATVGARRSAAYWLVTRSDTAAVSPPPPRPLRLLHDGDRVKVDTGVARFQIGPGELFREIGLAGGRRLATGGALSVSSGERIAGHSKVRRVWIEHAGPLSAAVVVDGAYDAPAVGGGGLGSRRRYLFAAGSPAVLVRHAVAWEGNLGCRGCIRTEDGRPNAVRIDRVRDVLQLDPEMLGASPDVLAVGAFGEPALSGRAQLSGSKGGGEIARVRQIQRARREDRLTFEVMAPGRESRGEKADGGLLAVGGSAGAVAVALDRMHRYEPQALRLLGDGRLAIDLADGHVWLAHHQGLFATLAVAALPDLPSRADLDRLVWAPLQHPLHAWPDAAWFAGSGAVEEIPAGRLPRGLEAYDRLIPDVLRLTQKRIDEDGLAGLMTFGVLPRYWGRWDGGEIRCKGKHDPTPQEAWDDTFWCSTWTDYHNTLATAPLWAMRSGEVEWLDDLAVPGALRTLHTQIMQCAPDDPWFYCGQAPAGYSGYREDFNSSHAYFDNLYLYYWLTGDKTVPDTLRRGAENMRRLMCPRRGPQPVTAAQGPEGPACPAGEPLDKASFSGRVGNQWLTAFRFLGLAGPDASFLEDYRSGLARMLTWQYAELQKDGKTYGFLGGDLGKKNSEAGPLWMNGFYDAEILHRWMIDSGNEPLGDPPLAPSRVLAAVAHTLVDQVRPLDAKTGGPQSLLYRFEGPRIGGRLVEIQGKGRDLFFPEKAGMAALLARAGRATGDRELLQAGRDLVDTILATSREENVPLGKLQGQYLARLPAAVGALAAEPRNLPDG